MLRRNIAIVGAALVIATMAGVCILLAARTRHRHDSPVEPGKPPGRPMAAASVYHASGLVVGSDACQHCWQAHVGYARMRIEQKEWGCVNAECCLAMDRSPGTKQFAEALFLMAVAAAARGEHDAAENFWEAASVVDAGCVEAQIALLEISMKRVDEGVPGRYADAADASSWRKTYDRFDSEVLLLEQRKMRAHPEAEFVVEYGLGRLGQALQRADLALHRAYEFRATEGVWRHGQNEWPRESAAWSGSMAVAEQAQDRRDWRLAWEAADQACREAPTSVQKAESLSLRGDIRAGSASEEGGSLWIEAVGDWESALELMPGHDAALAGLLRFERHRLRSIDGSGPVEEAHAAFRVASRRLGSAWFATVARAVNQRTAELLTPLVREVTRELAAAQVRVARASWTRSWK